MTIDWRLGLAPDIGGNVMQAYQQGVAQRRQNETRNALADYVNTGNQQALQAVTQNDPQMGMQLRSQAAQGQAAAMEQHQKQLQIMDRLLTGATPENYGQRLQMARQMGLDTTGAPQTYDPQWIQSTHTMVQALSDPQTMKDLPAIAQQVMLSLPPEQRDPNGPAFIEAMGRALAKNIPLQPGGGVAQYNPVSGQTQMVVTPNPGDQPVGAQASVGGPQPGAIVGGYRFKGGNPNDQNNWEMVGGAGGNASGPFQP